MVRLELEGGQDFRSELLDEPFVPHPNCEDEKPMVNMPLCFDVTPFHFALPSAC
jgi:hypothetical protein